MDVTRPLLALDAPALYYRAFHALPSTLRAPDGTPVNAVRGLLDMIASIIERLGSARVVAAFDADWRPAFRTAVLPEYKAARMRTDRDGGDETPEELEPQLPLIREALRLAGVPLLEAPGHEADDVLGTLAAQAASHARELIVVTGDRDLFALVAGDTVRVLYPGKEMSRARLIDATALQEDYGVLDGRAYREQAALRGDASDGLTGVSGIGEKTAARLVSEFGSLEEVLSAAAALDGDTAGTDLRVRAKAVGLSPRRAALIAGDAALARHTLRVMTTVDTLELPDVWDRTLPGERGVDALRAMAETHGFTRSAQHLLDAQEATLLEDAP